MDVCMSWCVFVFLLFIFLNEIRAQARSRKKKFLVPSKLYPSSLPTKIYSPLKTQACTLYQPIPMNSQEHVLSKLEIDNVIVDTLLSIDIA
jgi:hypothetical protein